MSDTLPAVPHPHHAHRSSRFRVSFAVPWVLLIVAVAYIAVTVMAGRAFLAGSESRQVLAAIRWLPVPVARVDGEFIWARQYLAYRTFIATFIDRAQQSGQAIDTATPVDEQVIQLVVSNKTVERAAKRAHLSVEDAEIDAAYDDILVAQGGGGEPKQVSQEELQTILNDLYGSSQGQLRELIRVRLLETKVRDELLEQVNFRQILTTDEAQANDLIGKLQNGEPFDELAKQYSQHAESRDNGGNIGFVARGQQLPAIEAAIFSNPVGLITTPVKTDFGFHVIEVLGTRGTVQQSFEDWLETARNSYRIRVFYRPAAN